MRRTAGHAQPKPNDPPPSGELQIVFGKAAYTFSDETIIFDPALGLAISNKNIFPRKTELTEQLLGSGGILAVPRNRKLSEFRSEPFHRRENNSEFRAVEQK